jgi:Cytochrome c554 and c-prime
MKAHGRHGIVLALLLGCGLLFVASQSLLTRGRAQQASPAAVPATLAGMLGTASCSGRACHGGLGTAGSKGCEYTTWMLQPDPHTRAFAVLDSERSRRMVKNLRRLKVDLDEVLPQADALCLSCHGPAALAGPGASNDGFACESCHGPADKWLQPHTAAAWAKRSAADKRALGFQPMDSLADRARVCTACHVGAGERDVNHDLIAAGHPRLNFEFDTYYANLPRHWQPERDQGHKGLVGQTVCAEAALQLLAYRAETRHHKPWPEFAEYDCFACHHDLQARSGRQARGYGQRIPGTLPWSDWYYALPAALGGPELRGDLATLGRLMAQPLPDQKQVKQAAQTSADRLKAWLAAAKDRPTPSALFPKLIADDRTLFPRTGDSITVANWDSAAQMTLALQAEYQERKIDNPQAAKALTELFGLLQFSKTGSFDSPVTFDGPALVKQIQEVCTRLETKP